MTHFQFGSFFFDVASGSLFVNKSTEDQQEITLRNKVANLLAYLINHRNRVVTKDELLNALWQHGDYRDNALTQSIRELRIALGDSAQNPSFVKTYPQRGYQWIHALTEAEPLQVTEKSESKKITRKIAIGLVGILCLVAVILLIRAVIDNKTINQVKVTETQEKQSISSLLVLPLINSTDDNTMDWLELGLADMLAVDIQRKNTVKVTPPAMAKTMLINAQLTWPTLPIHIRSLLKDQQLDVALFATVRLYNNQQVLDFQLLYANGETQQGSISYPSLPAEISAISQQLIHLLQPEKKRAIKIEVNNPIALQAIAEGMQALQQRGALDAERYFRAAMTISPEEYWAQAYLARSLVALGKWQSAEELLLNVPQIVREKDASLNAFIHYWLAELAYKQGHTDIKNKVNQSTKIAEAAADINMMTKNYRLQANIAWFDMDWQSHDIWINKANRLFGVDTSLAVEADKLFYLGNPSNSGLEKSPTLDLEQNKTRLLKALSFYQLLEDRPMIAASQLAIAENYYFSLEERKEALNKALSMYRQLALPYELAQALIYAGFFQMQLHDGLSAAIYFNEAKEISTRLGSKNMVTLSDFYIAFATLDQGLDQSHMGGHGTQKEYLHTAVNQLTQFIEQSNSAMLTASAWVFLGWANTELAEYDLAITQLEQAQIMNKSLNMTTTYGYTIYSMMRVYLAQQKFDEIIALASEPLTTRLQAVYLARAYFEKHDIQQAIATLNHFKQQLPSLWHSDDDTRLAQYHRALAGNTIELLAEPKAHIVYCESDWTL